MKRFVSLILVIMMILCIFAGCGASGTTSPQSVPSDTTSGIPQSNSVSSFDSNTNYVMIYNPKIYDEAEYVHYDELNSGDFSSQIDTTAYRGEGLDTESKFVPFTTSTDCGDIDLGKINISGNRAGLVSQYNVGDTSEFYCGMNSRSLETFTCEYAGDKCYIWVLDSAITSSQAALYGAEFDSKIYNNVVNEFGSARFVEDGDKVHILYYDIDSNGIIGFFNSLDLFASNEVTQEEITGYGINTDRAIININSAFCDYTKVMYSTMAHEFQHLINMTSILYMGKFNGTWINEAMSGYIEENLYPGSKEELDHYGSLMTSDLIRGGQSLYNFTTDNSLYSFDIGVYGSVYLFSEYLTKIGGDNVFSNIHSYYRTIADETTTDANAVVYSLPVTTASEIDESYDYPSTYFFGSDDERILSKLTLSYYISLMYEIDPSQFENIKSQALLYNELSSTIIEGGGRVILATQNGSFEVPSDADDGLVYVALDDNFRPTGEIIYG